MLYTLRYILTHLCLLLAPCPQPEQGGKFINAIDVLGSQVMLGMPSDIDFFSCPEMSRYPFAVPGLQSVFFPSLTKVGMTADLKRPHGFCVMTKGKDARSGLNNKRKCVVGGRQHRSQH